MANADEFQDCLEIADECLEFIQKTIKTVKESVDTEEKEVENKNEISEDTKITIEANTRTLEALKRNLDAIKKSIEDNNATTNGAKNSLDVLDEIVKCKKQIVSNGNKTFGENGLSAEENIADATRNVEKTAKNMNGVKSKIAAGNYDEKALKIVETVNRFVDNNTKAFGIEESFSEETTQTKNGKPYKEKTAETLEEEKKFVETWDTILNRDITDNVKTDEPNKKFVRRRKKLVLVKDEFMQGNGKPPRTEENSEETEGETDNYCKMVVMEGMDNPLNAMLFSEQLIEYVLNKLGHTWPCVDGARNLPKRSVSTRFTKVIGEAMLAIIERNIGMITDSYKQLLNKNIHTIDLYRTEVCITATFYFEKGFSHPKFLVYAAQLAGLSAFYFTSGNMQIAEASAQVLAYILNFYIYQLCFSPTFDWFNLHLEAQILKKDIQEGKILFVMPSDITGSASQVQKAYFN